MPDAQYDLIVLGGGTGGYVAAIHAAQLGLKTALVDAGKVGGTCLHRGCIPTKALLQTADLLNTFRHRTDFGLEADNVGFNYPKVLAKKDKVVNHLYRGVQYLLKKNEIEVIEGWGRMLDSHRIEITAKGKEVRVISAQNILLATGSVPRELPGMPFDGDRIISSDHVLERKEIPKSLLILGGGAIGIEFASMYQDFGAEVTLVEMQSHILPQDDPDIANELHKILEKRGVKILVNATVKTDTINVENNAVHAKIDTDNGILSTTTHALLVAIGRKAVVDNIGLETVGVTVERGFIKVDENYQTAVANVYAIGDVIGGYLLAHVAAHEGMIAVEHMAGKMPESLDPHRVPRVTYCRPEVASVGLTEEEARAAGYTVKTGVFPFRANGKSLILGEPEGFVKVVADEKTDILLGAHIIGPHASDLINEMALAKFLEATAWEVAESVHAHPTVSEVLHEAALAVDGMAIHI